MITFRVRRSTVRRTGIHTHGCLNYWQVKLGIGVSVDPKLWDCENQKLRKSATGAATINTSIAQARTDIEGIMARLQALGHVVMPELLHSEWDIIRGKGRKKEQPPPQPKQPDDYLSREEAKRMLRLSFQTLRNLEERGELMPVRIARRVLYRRRDIEAALKGTEVGRWRSPK